MSDDAVGAIAVLVVAAELGPRSDARDTALIGSKMAATPPARKTRCISAMAPARSAT
jgi:hypothetical protein